MTRRGSSRPPTRQGRRSDRLPASGEKVAARGADRREQAAFADSQEPVWLRVALDALARHR
ncbi:MAG: hypothetical protein ACO3JL_17280, partial [Myxococcota bacterium]